MCSVMQGFGALCLKRLKWEPQTADPKNIEEYSGSIRTLVGIFLVYSYYILGAIYSLDSCIAVLLPRHAS